jgi:deferrochelatase/peroxidase EfeB
LKREAGITYVVLRKIHYNVMRFNSTFELNEAEVFAGRFKSVSARYYVVNDPEKLSGKYISAWQNFGIKSF